MKTLAYLIVTVTTWPYGRDQLPEMHASYIPKASIEICERDRHNMVLARPQDRETSIFLFCSDESDKQR